MFGILDFGAHNDGPLRSTEAVRSAIKAVQRAGGSTVYILPGTYISGPFELASRTVLHIEALRLDDIVASAKTGLKVSQARGLEFRGVQINAQSGPAFLTRNSTESILDDVSTRHPLEDDPVVRLDSCPETVVRNCVTFHGTGTFLSTPRVP